MTRSVGYGSLLLATVAAVGYAVVRSVRPLASAGGIDGVTYQALLLRALGIAAVVFGGYALYRFALSAYDRRTDDVRRVHVARNVLRLVVGASTAVAALGVATNEWVGLLFSFGVVGFGATFALQQPLFSLIGWLYITTKRPYQVGDRVAIEGSKGDVAEVDLLVTTLYEVEGDLVSSHQPSGRVITLPNSVVLSSHVHNYTREAFPYVWNEVTVQVAYETDLAFARERMCEVADDCLGDEMARRVADYRRSLDGSPVNVDVSERPTVNVRQRESWVELSVRYVADPREMQATRNELYERVLAAFNEEPERVQFPIGRFR